ncbi:MAG: PxxKW family cysteine-rich protein [Desulfovibrio sp.]|nr:PxxKW family cysteine-rich protein [Desulfovibrio sp.]
MSFLENAVKTGEGVMLNGFLLSPVVEQCSGCDRVREFEGERFCSSYPAPEKKWTSGRCNFATHVKTQVATTAKVNPLKASKRAAKGGH